MRVMKDNPAGKNAGDALHESNEGQLGREKRRRCPHESDEGQLGREKRRRCPS
ncbi:hypothetical protein [Neobacillus sp. FSL H8-0543]|uniref:hypothetical protein n=1 Tax=Neobacillus sp. FSL H8-0543 TaxID=2954672 RepID=UPI003158E491